ncbi:cellulase family glycosylhydrolase [Flavobacterium sp.]|uniref:cellulase family glycosylhydrolase n=1 Tax=Flavobacterium sp. TaxID=239 RepID=UPI0037501647
MKKQYILFSFLFTLFSCRTDRGNQDAGNYPLYSISGTKILNSGIPKQFIGANALHTFGGESNDMNSWNLDIVREFVGNMNENPISGSTIQDSNGAFLHSLQDIVDNNRLNNKVTILCAFGWNGTNETMFTGKRPTQTFWWNDYKLKLEQWAIHFKNQPDVWLEVWNEPYRYDRADGYTDEIWQSDMNQLVDVIRSSNNENIILIPCAEQGQDESVLINKGAVFLSNKTNILFDVHAYEKWLLVNDAIVETRLQNLKINNLPIIFGEIAPMNASVLMNTQPLLSKIHNRGLSVCAWLWKYDENDTDALLTSTGLSNDTANNNWGSIYKSLSLDSRNP